VTPNSGITSARRAGTRRCCSAARAGPYGVVATIRVGTVTVVEPLMVTCERLLPTPACQHLQRPAAVRSFPDPSPVRRREIHSAWRTVEFSIVVPNCRPVAVRRPLEVRLPACSSIRCTDSRPASRLAGASWHRPDGRGARLLAICVWLLTWMRTVSNRETPPISALTDKFRLDIEDRPRQMGTAELSAGRTSRILASDRRSQPRRRSVARSNTSSPSGSAPG